MQKWIGVGHIDGEPIEVQYGNQTCTLLWMSCPRSWSPKGEDSIPLMFIGKRRDIVAQAGVEKFDGITVYILGEISSRIKLKTPKQVNIGVCVFVTSMSIWDTKSIERYRKAKITNEIIYETSGLESIEEGETNER